MAPRFPIHRFAFPQDRGRRDRLGDRERLLREIERRGRPIEDCLHELGIDPYYLSQRILDIDDTDIWSDPRRDGIQEPVRGTRDRWAAGATEEYPATIFRTRTMANPRDSPPQSIGKAMKNLQKQVAKAEQCYSDFVMEYDNDVQFIRKYGSREVLKELWAAKVTGKKSTDFEDGGDEGVENYRKKFDEQKKSLLGAMKNAASSELKETGSAHYTDAFNEKSERAIRLLDRVALFRDQISRLLEKAPSGEHYCKDLVNELGQLKSLVDPESELYKDLYKDSGCDDGEEGGSSQSGGDGSY